MKTYWRGGVGWFGVMKAPIDDAKAQADVTSLLHTVSDVTDLPSYIAVIQDQQLVTAVNF